MAMMKATGLVAFVKIAKRRDLAKRSLQRLRALFKPPSGYVQFSNKIIIPAIIKGEALWLCKESKNCLMRKFPDCPLFHKSVHRPGHGLWQLRLDFVLSCARYWVRFDVLYVVLMSECCDMGVQHGIHVVGKIESSMPAGRRQELKATL